MTPSRTRLGSVQKDFDESSFNRLERRLSIQRELAGSDQILNSVARRISLQVSTPPYSNQLYLRSFLKCYNLDDFSKQNKGLPILPIQIYVVTSWLVY